MSSRHPTPRELCTESILRLLEKERKRHQKFVDRMVKFAQGELAKKRKKMTEEP